jgi:hypothetical protein
MVCFFFYKNLTNVDLINKININYQIIDGYTIVHSYDQPNNILKINNNNNNNNNTILYGKIVTFNMKLIDVLDKINDIEECKIGNKNQKSKFTLDTIGAYNIYGKTYNAYIIY